VAIADTSKPRSTRFATRNNGRSATVERLRRSRSLGLHRSVERGLNGQLAGRMAQSRPARGTGHATPTTPRCHPDTTYHHRTVRFQPPPGIRLDQHCRTGPEVDPVGWLDILMARLRPGGEGGLEAPALVVRGQGGSALTERRGVALSLEGRRHGHDEQHPYRRFRECCSPQVGERRVGPLSPPTGRSPTASLRHPGHTRSGSRRPSATVATPAPPLGLGGCRCRRDGACQTGPASVMGCLRPTGEAAQQLENLVAADQLVGQVHERPDDVSLSGVRHGRDLRCPSGSRSSSRRRSRIADATSLAVRPVATACARSRSMASAAPRSSCGSTCPWPGTPQPGPARSEPRTHPPALSLPCRRRRCPGPSETRPT